MILLVSSASGASECAAELEKATGEASSVAQNVRRATQLLRSEQYAAIVLDQCTMEGEESDRLLALAGTAVPVLVNLAINGATRVVREVRSALQRRERDQMAALAEAESRLRRELNGPVTGILISSELALAVPALPPAVEAKLRSVYELASEMSSRLKLSG